MQAKLKLSENEVCDLIAKALSQHVFCFDVTVDAFEKDGYEFIVSYKEVEGSAIQRLTSPYNSAHHNRITGEYEK